MIRTLILTLLNFMLPFLLRFIYLAVKRWWVRKYNKKHNTSIKEPDWQYPWKLFIIIALGLTLSFVMVERVFLFDADTGFERVAPKSVNSADNG